MSKLDGVKQVGVDELGTSQQPYRGELPELDIPLGRAREIAEVLDRLRSPPGPKMRLLTLTGPPGVGKTRVGIQAARELRGETGDQVHFVQLESVKDPDLVLPTVTETVAQKLGLEETEKQQPLERLKDYLKDARVLLFLDTFEQVMAASPQVEELLEACPKLKVLVTSQHVLGLNGYEQVYIVPPLELPDPKHLADLEALSRNPAVALYLQRATKQDPSFSLDNGNAPDIVKICIRLDGLPLTIIFVADWIRRFAPPTVLEEQLLDTWLPDLLSSNARGLPARQQTLWNSLGRSYELLNEDEQRLFRWLGVFRGGFTLKAAKAVCGEAGGLSASVLKGLGSLADKSLLQWPGRKAGDKFRPMLLQTVREYALERLRADDEKARELQRAHAKHYLSLAEKAEPKLNTKEQSAWLDRLETEHDNLRMALCWLIEQGEAEMALSLSGALWRFWLKRGYQVEGLERLESALIGSEQVDSSIRAKALGGAGILASYLGHYDRAKELCKESQTLFQDPRNDQGIAVAVIGLARVARAGANYAGARTMFKDAQKRYEAVRDEWGVGRSLHHLSVTEYMQGQGNYDAARSLIEQSLDKLESTGDKHAIASAQVTQALIASAQGHPLITSPQGDQISARKLAEKSLEAMQRLRDPRGIARGLRSLADIAFTQDDHPAAYEAYKESLTMFSELSDKWNIPRCLEGLAELAASRKQLKWAAQLYGAAEIVREDFRAPIPQGRLVKYELDWANLRDNFLQHLDEATFTAAWAEGRWMTPEQAAAAELVAEATPHVDRPHGLTYAEVRALRWTRTALTAQQIGRELHNSSRTVERHLRNSYPKIGVNSRVAAALWVERHRNELGLNDDDEGRLAKYE